MARSLPRFLGIGSGLVAGLLCREAAAASHNRRLSHCETLPTKRPVVVCGPSGVGKGTLLNKLMAEYPDEFGFSVSHTTRAPRPGEQNGVHYHFTSKEEMQAAIDRGEFIEYANVHTNLYGTSISAVQAVAVAGKTCLLDIDVQGAELVKRTDLNARFVFVAPPSMDALEQRLRGRGTESEEKIQVRLKNALGEMEYLDKPGFFDLVLVNDDLSQAYAQLKCFLLPDAPTPSSRRM